MNKTKTGAYSKAIPGSCIFIRPPEQKGRFPTAPKKDYRVEPPSQIEMLLKPLSQKKLIREIIDARVDLISKRLKGS